MRNWPTSLEESIPRSAECGTCGQKTQNLVRLLPLAIVTPTSQYLWLRKAHPFLFVLVNRIWSTYQLSKASYKLFKSLSRLWNDSYSTCALLALRSSTGAPVQEPPE